MRMTLTIALLLLIGVASAQSGKNPLQSGTPQDIQKEMIKQRQQQSAPPKTNQSRAAAQQQTQQKIQSIQQDVRAPQKSAAPNANDFIR